MSIRQWTPIRLTMSSSSDTQLSTSSSYKFKPTPTVFYSNELQEVTSCTKETVRITPPPHDAVALRPTVLTLDNTPNGTPYQSNRNARSSSSTPKMSSKLTDKQCQTDDVFVYSASKLTNSVDSFSNDEARSTTTSKDTLSVSPTTPSHQPMLTAESSRELDHINVIINECQTSPDNISCESIDMSNFKEDTDTPDHKIAHHRNLDSKVTFSADKYKDYDTEDTCCVKCLLTALQICDCCHIS